MEQALPHPKDKWIPWCFVVFFAVIAVLDGIFVYMAVSTQTGLVTEEPYEKGLAYNETLAKAKYQPVLKNEISYDSGILRWRLPIANASVRAMIVRPVQEGYDYRLEFQNIGGGLYEAKANTPLPGAWTANLSATWDDQTYQRTYDFIVK